MQLKRHLDTNLPQLKDKSVSFFKRHKEVHKTGMAALHIISHVKTGNENATQASFLISYRIAHAGKPHTISENLIKPCIADNVSCVLREDAAKKLQQFSVPITSYLIEFIRFQTILKNY